jgi:hypothetical protein
MRWKFLLLLPLLFAAHSNAQVRVWEGILELPVYEEGAPDSNPSFDQFATNRFSYPYTLRKEITDQRIVHKLRAIYLENEYLKCSVLPDIGGHVYTCLDKISDQSMFYANPSIKKARIGYRGAWAAFGIEFNFPVAHSWVTVSPVDSAIRQNPDGSATVVVSSVDRVTGMQWRVDSTLRSKIDVLEQRVTLYNPSIDRHSYYWWSTAAVPMDDESTTFIMPTALAATHGVTEVDTWPVSSAGVDLSVTGNHIA